MGKYDCDPEQCGISAGFLSLIQEMIGDNYRERKSLPRVAIYVGVITTLPSIAPSQGQSLAKSHRKMFAI